MGRGFGGWGGVLVSFTVKKGWGGEGNWWGWGEGSGAFSEDSVAAVVNSTYYETCACQAWQSVMTIFIIFIFKDI